MPWPSEDDEFDDDDEEDYVCPECGATEGEEPEADCPFIDDDEFDDEEDDDGDEDEPAAKCIEL